MIEDFLEIKIKKEGADKMYRGIIFDNLLDKNILTKKCSTEQEAKEEARKSQERLAKKFKTDITRFDIIGVEIK